MLVWLVSPLLKFSVCEGNNWFLDFEVLDLTRVGLGMASSLTKRGRLAAREARCGVSSFELVSVSHVLLLGSVVFMEERC